MRLNPRKIHRRSVTLINVFDKHTPHTTHHTPHTTHHTPQTTNHTPHTTHHTPNTKHQTPNTKHQTPYTLHHTPLYNKRKEKSIKSFRGARPIGRPGPTLRGVIARNQVTYMDCTAILIRLEIPVLKHTNKEYTHWNVQ
jgi:hypothetical protein